MTAIICIVLFAYILYTICNSILKATGWTDPKERKAATMAVMTSAIVNSKSVKK